jgi:exosortase
MLQEMTRLLKPIYLQIWSLFALLIILYFPFVRTMVEDWNMNDNYSHGYLIPWVSAFMVYTMRREIREVIISPSNIGLPLIILGLIQLTVANIGSEYFLQRTSMIPVLFGLSLFLVGKPFTKKISIPILYLIFMIPIPAIIWNQVAFPMKLFASALSEKIIQTVGIPVLREGNILHLANTTLEVIDACSGLRSLTSMLALSTAFAYLSHHSVPRKWVLFLSAIPIAILVNVVRLTITAGLANQFGEEIALGFLHELSGWVTFALGLVMLIGVHFLLSRARRANCAAD